MRWIVVLFMALGSCTAARAAAPPRALAPFDAAQAAAHQQAWAEHAGVTVAVKNSLGMNLGLVPPGAITMGSPDQEARRLPEETPHRVVLTRSVRLAACEVTQGQWEALMDDNPANAFGIHDMHGNMSEWCADGYAADTYAKAPLEDPPGSVDAEACVIRGGAWRFSCDDCRSAVRHGYDPRIRAYDVGFRVAVDLPGDVGPGTNARSSVGSNAGTEPSPEEP